MAASSTEKVSTSRLRTHRGSTRTPRNENVNPDNGCRLLTLSDLEPAAQVLSRAFANDPLITYMLPVGGQRRIETLHRFFMVYGEINIKNQRGYGIGDPLQGV